MSTLEIKALQKLFRDAKDLGVDPGPIEKYLHTSGSSGSRMWAEQHPEEDRAPCCWESLYESARCTCWVPVYDQEQAAVCPPQQAGDIAEQPKMCGDCAYRPDSPERSGDDFVAEMLLDLPAAGDVFWCHEGMRRPSRWVHPDGRTVEGSPHDWQPPIHAGIPYRLDGRPGLICAGWAARAKQAAKRGDV